MRPVVKFEDNGCVPVPNSLPSGISSLPTPHLCVLIHVSNTVCRAVHLVPPSCHERWFKRNRMQQYNWGQPTGIDDLASGVSLRLDLTKIWV